MPGSFNTSRPGRAAVRRGQSKQAVCWQTGRAGRSGGLQRGACRIVADVLKPGREFNSLSLSVHVSLAYFYMDRGEAGALFSRAAQAIAAQQRPGAVVPLATQQIALAIESHRAAATRADVRVGAEGAVVIDQKGRAAKDLKFQSFTRPQSFSASNQLCHISSRLAPCANSSRCFRAAIARASNDSLSLTAPRSGRARGFPRR